MGATAVRIPGWQTGSGRRLAGLAVARLANQMVGVVWFVLSARVLDETQFGMVGAGLAIVVVVGALSDLGATRTLVRHVALDQRLLWPAYRRALEQRVLFGSVLGALTVAGFAVADIDVPLEVVALAAAIALASGVTELAFAALRAVGLVRTEMVLLVVERSAFAAGAGALGVAGGGAVPVLVAYSPPTRRARWPDS